jgi:hypothetical protein
LFAKKQTERISYKYRKTVFSHKARLDGGQANKTVLKKLEQKVSAEEAERHKLENVFTCDF